MSNGQHLNDAAESADSQLDWQLKMFLELLGIESVEERVAHALKVYAEHGDERSEEQIRGEIAQWIGDLDSLVASPLFQPIPTI